MVSSRRQLLAHVSWAITGACVPVFGVAAMPGLADSGSPDQNAMAPENFASPGVMLGKNWQAGMHPQGYLVSEKLDGVRALWDGQVLRFRSGRVIAAPAWFVAGFPKTPMDGELWMGRQQFDRLSGAVRKTVPLDHEWHGVRYMVFDIPADNGKFEQRAAAVKDLIARANVAWLVAVEQNRAADPQALAQMLHRTVSEGGEGLMLHHAQATWKSGRSDALRKLKLVPDEDGIVLAHIPGKGHLQGKMGALLVQTPHGQRFALGSGFTDAQRDSPPEVGTLVTYRYRDRTAQGLPKFASFFRQREIE